jgi:hypothetical protein
MVFLLHAVNDSKGVPRFFSLTLLTRSGTMIRVFLLRHVILGIKSATVISDLLKPATWKKIAIAHGLVGLSFFLVYGFLDRRVQETDIPPVAIAQLVPARVPIAQRPALWLSSPEIVAIIRVDPSQVGQSFTLSINGSNFNSQTTILRLTIDSSASISPESDSIEVVSDTLRLSHFSTHGYPTSTVLTPLISSRLGGSSVIESPVTQVNNTFRIARFGWKAQHASLVSFNGDAYLNEMGITKPFDGFGNPSSRATDVALASIADSVPGGWKLPSIGAPERNVVLRRESTGGQSLLETILKLLALFQGITMMINGSVASVLGLIAYHRNKVDMAVKHLDFELKRLQILQIQQQLDKQARERQKEVEEAARSSIVLIS